MANGMRYTYEEMPKDTTILEDMHIITGDIQQYGVRVQEVSYEKEGTVIPIKLLSPKRLDENKKYPIYLHIQGSAWMKQDMNDHIEDLKDIASGGYIVAILGYRPTPEYLFPTQVKDAKSGIRFLYENQEKYGIDFTKAFLGGDSSGGHTAVMCYATWNSDLFDDEKTTLPSICGFIDCYGPVNISTMVEQVSAIDRSYGMVYPESIFIGKEVRDDYELAQTTNPIHYLDSQKEPLYILHGNKDRLVPYAQSVELYQA